MDNVISHDDLSHTPIEDMIALFIGSLMAVIQQWDNSPDIALPTKRERAELTVLNLKQSRNYQRKLGINDNDYRYLILSE